MKRCNFCKEIKNIIEFSKDKNTKDGLQNKCKPCFKKIRSDYYLNNKEYIKNKNTLWRLNNKEKIKNNRIKFYLKNKTKIIKKNINNFKIKIKNNINFKLRLRLSKSIWRYLKYNSSSKLNNSYLKHFPYTINDLKLHIESLFEPWMNWNNYGSYKVEMWKDNDSTTWKWNIDHIIPQSKLIYTSMEDENFKICWALENLRPYSAKQNIIDGSTKIRHA